MKRVYTGCLGVLKPGGLCILVTGDYYRDKKRVPIGDDTIRLMEHIGFEFIRRHKRIYNHRSYFIEAMWQRCDHLKIGRRKNKEDDTHRTCSSPNAKQYRTSWMFSMLEEAKEGTVNVECFPTRDWCKQGVCTGWVNTLEKIDWEDVLVFRKP